MHAGERVARAADEHRRAVGEAGQPGHPGDALHRLGESRAVPPRPVQTEGGHAHHHELGVDLVHALPAEPELLHDPGGVVLDEHIGAAQQALEHRNSLGPGQIEGDASLSGVGGVEDRAPFPPGVLGGTLGARVAHQVGTGGRLHFDDIGAQAGQHVERRRACPPGRAVDDPQTGQGELPVCRGGHRPPLPGDRARVRPDRGGGPEGRRCGARDAVWHAGLAEASGRGRHEDPALDELLEVADRLPVQHGPGRDPMVAGLGEELSRCPLGRVRVDSGEELVAPLEAVHGPGQVLVLH